MSMTRNNFPQEANSFGRQYEKDDSIDKTGFRRRARLHQSKFRCETLKCEEGRYGNRLTEEDGKKGLNFYSGFGIYKEVQKQFSTFKEGLHSDMLRSEHIPFNLFIPLNHDRDFCKKLFNTYLEGMIKTVDQIRIEWAPSPQEDYLNDRTSFDACIEFTATDGLKGMIGIEVKYTEHEYRLQPGSKQERDIRDPSSKYYEIMEISQIYQPGMTETLISDRFRQVWRNQLLGESILIVDRAQFKHFVSFVIFPKGNAHFVEVSKEYMKLLKGASKKFVPITYEEFFETARALSPNEDFLKWIEYLSRRYIVRTDP